MSFLLTTVQDLLLVAFLGLGSAWFAVSLFRQFFPRPSQAAPSFHLAPAHPAPEPPAPAALPAPESPAPPTHPAVAAPAPSATALPGTHLAVIAATVHHLYRGRARLLDVHPIEPPALAVVDWAREGRRDIFASHRLR